MTKFKTLIGNNTFNIVSWFVTLALVAGLVFGALSWKQSTSTVSALAPQPTAAPDQKQPDVSMPALGASESFLSIGRSIQLKTNIPADKPRYGIEEYRVTRGDSIFAISESFKLKPETVLWANYDVLQDDPHSLKPGQVLKIPPTDGIYYQMKENDKLDKVATEFKANLDDILNYPGNAIDLSNPTVASGSWVMIPGGKREFGEIGRVNLRQRLANKAQHLGDAIIFHCCFVGFLR